MHSPTETKLLDRVADHESRVWISNSHENTLSLCIEPWGTQLHLLPQTQYAVISGFDRPEQVVAPTIEPDECLKVWPQGNTSNRIYREDGNLVWDDDRPSAVYSHLDDALVTLVTAFLKSSGRTNLETLDQWLQSNFPGVHNTRPDIHLLLVEHGILLLRDGSLTLPIHARMTRPASE